MHTVKLPRSQLALPALGLGTAHLGESDARSRTRAAEVEAVRLALDLGYRLIDTAEMYGEGGAEEVVGAALRAWLASPGARREDVIVVTKVTPHNASRAGALAACERSLVRLGLDHIDLYLLHWRGRHPLADTVAAFDTLQRDGRIGHWGVSNFDRDDMDELWRLPDGAACAADQVYYCAAERGIEFDLLPALRARAVPAIAYTPLALGALARSRSQVALAVTGVAGPGGGSRAKPVGTVWLAWAAQARRGAPLAVIVERHRFAGDRAAVRTGAIRAALEGVVRILDRDQSRPPARGARPLGRAAARKSA